MNFWPGPSRRYAFLYEFSHFHRRAKHDQQKNDNENLFFIVSHEFVISNSTRLQLRCKNRPPMVLFASFFFLCSCAVFAVAYFLQLLAERKTMKNKSCGFWWWWWCGGIEHNTHNEQKQKEASFGATKQQLGENVEGRRQETNNSIVRTLQERRNNMKCRLACNIDEMKVNLVVFIVCHHSELQSLAVFYKFIPLECNF